MGTVLRTRRLIGLVVFRVFENFLRTFWINFGTAGKQYFLHFGQIGTPIVLRAVFRDNS